MGDKVSGIGSAIYNGAAYVGNKISNGAGYVADKALNGLSSAYDVVSNGAQKAYNSRVVQGAIHYGKKAGDFVMNHADIAGGVLAGAGALYLTNDPMAAMNAYRAGHAIGGMAKNMYQGRYAKAGKKVDKFRGEIMNSPYKESILNKVGASEDQFNTATKYSKRFLNTAQTFKDHGVAGLRTRFKRKLTPKEKRNKQKKVEITNHSKPTYSDPITIPEYSRPVTNNTTTRIPYKSKSSR
jgi:hypothetical protein